MTYIRFQTLEPNTNDSIVKTERLNKNNKIINIKRCTKTPALEARATHQETPCFLMKPSDHPSRR